jgi:hypothetical protein
MQRNLGIRFEQPKCTELTTADAGPGMTVPAKGSHLGQAIPTLKPTFESAGESRAAAKQAEKEAWAETRQPSDS